MENVRIQIALLLVLIVIVFFAGFYSRPAVFGHICEPPPQDPLVFQFDESTFSQEFAKGIQTGLYISGLYKTVGVQKTNGKWQFYCTNQKIERGENGIATTSIPQP
jgi:hypothetical protein